MKDIEKYKGIEIFSPAYQMMFENDSHAPGSVDRVLGENMVKLCSQTVEYLYSAYTPITLHYEKESRPKLESRVKEIISRCSSIEEIVARITQFVSKLQEKAEQDFDKVQVGGLEEEIIERGSDWCTDLARVSCVLCQVAGLPARIVTLINIKKAYSGHEILEVFRNGVWGTVDPTTNVIYRHDNDNPATTWELMNDPKLITQHWRDESTPYTKPEQFRAAAIVNYFIWQWKEYDYTISGVNEYYRSILKMSDKGWPGGLRWLHNEDAK